MLILQAKPITKIQSSIKSDIDEKVSKTQFEASDGRTYKFMGSQWAELLRSGKTGLVARRTIAAELNRRAGIAKPKKSRKRLKLLKKQKLPNLLNKLMIALLLIV